MCPCIESVELMPQINVEDGSERFRVAIAGNVIATRSDVFLAVRPTVLVVLAGKGEIRARALRVSFAEEGEGSSELALASLAVDSRTPPQAFSLSAACDSSFEEVLSWMRDGRHGREAPFPVSLQVDLAYPDVCRHSPPFDGKAVIRPGITLHPRIAAEATEHHLFDCHSDWWWGWRTGRYTICHGPCSEVPGVGPACATDDGKQWDNGWRLCWC